MPPPPAGSLDRVAAAASSSDDAVYSLLEDRPAPPASSSSTYPALRRPSSIQEDFSALTRSASTAFVEAGNHLSRASLVALEVGQQVSEVAVETAKKPITWGFIGLMTAAFTFGFLSGGATVLSLPHNGYDFVCHAGETNVDLDTACERIRVYEGAAAARRRQLTSVPTAYSCLPHYRVPVTGTNGLVTFPYHATSDMMKPEARHASSTSSSSSSSPPPPPSCRRRRRRRRPASRPRPWYGRWASIRSRSLSSTARCATPTPTSA